MMHVLTNYNDPEITKWESRKQSPGFVLFVRDWLCSHSIRNMTGEQVKAYVYLLCESWLASPRATLPADEEKLALLARVTPSEWQRNREVILSKFEHDLNGRIYNPKLREMAVKQAVWGINGAKGGRPKKPKRKPNQ